MENSSVNSGLTAKARRAPAPEVLLETAFGCPREFLGNRFIYVLVSARARGLSVGVNMNPDKRCDFDCLYCEVNRGAPARELRLELDLMAVELENTLAFVHSGRLRDRPHFRALPDELLQLRHVTLSGDGEPTRCPNFDEAVETVAHLRALGRVPCFKIVLVTNAAGLDLSAVQRGLKSFGRDDEIWAKLDAGTQAYMNVVNRPKITLERVMANILLVARQRPVVIQSLFPLLNGEEPPQREIEAYAQRLNELKAGGARIPLVQIYSATRPTLRSECRHLPLKSLSRIARTVHDLTGLQAEVF